MSVAIPAIEAIEPGGTLTPRRTVGKTGLSQADRADCDQGREESGNAHSHQTMQSDLNENPPNCVTQWEESRRWVPPVLREPRLHPV